MNAELHDLEPPPWPGAASIARALFVLFWLAAMLLAVLVLVSPTVWPSPQELRVIKLLAGQEAGPLAFGRADHVELEASSDCLGNCLGFRVRLYGDGRVHTTEWGFTCAPGMREGQLNAVEAQRLMAAVYVAAQPLARPRPWTGAVVAGWIRFSHAGRLVAHDYAVLPLPGEHRALGQALTALEQVGRVSQGHPEFAPDGFYCTQPDGSRRPVEP